MARSIAKACLRFTGLFEAELLVELLLRHWNHPLADDEKFRTALLEAASEVLRASVGGERLFQEIEPQNVNLVAAIWYAESQSVDESAELEESERKLRRDWLDTILRTIPSCFCDPEFLD
jgi:hypothetical protein